MPRRASPVQIPVLRLSDRPELPAYRRLYEALREAVLQGRLRPGHQLPPSRTFAEELGCSRTTVLAALDQLLAEGYIESRQGAGTFVSTKLPASPPPGNSITREASADPSSLLSARGILLAGTPVSRSEQAARRLPFHTGPDLAAFPRSSWARIAARRMRALPSESFSYPDPAGYPPLREAIAEYLRVVRSVRCTADQIVIVSGSQQAIDLGARLLLDPGDHAWVEDPGYLGARAALTAAGVDCDPVPVDGEGLDIVWAQTNLPRARLAYVTPSHQFPLGVTMTLERRLQLLQWASQHSAWILEDDYDSEFRYAGRPLSSLHGLAQGGRVVYLGTFSKVLFPALRIGYMVVPAELAPTVSAARGLLDRGSPLLPQAVLADFIAEGHFARHIRHMRSLYAERQAALLDAAEKELHGLLRLQPAEAGMHLVGWLPDGVDDVSVSAAARRAGLDVAPLSQFSLGRPRAGLILGYTAMAAGAIAENVRLLGTVLREGDGALQKNTKRV